MMMTMLLEINSILDSRYRIQEILAHSGTGAVYRAYDLRMQQDVAIKQITLATEEANAELDRRIVHLMHLRHPNLPQLNAHFTLAGSHYWVMDFIPGETLAQRGVIPEAQALEWIAQLAGVLSYLHGHVPPVIHGNIKPQNVKVTPQGQLFLVDWGLRAADGRDDIYALGATLYALLTGQMPQADYAPPRQLNPAIPPLTEQVILLALEARPDHRPQTAAQFLQMLRGEIPPVVEIPPPPKPPNYRPGAVLLGGWIVSLIILAVLLALRPPEKLRRPPTPIVRATATLVTMPTRTPIPTPTEVEIVITPQPLPQCNAIGQTWTRPSDIAEMVCVPGGEFVMGSADAEAYPDEKPQHTLTLDAFWIDRTEVTNRQYNKCVRAGACIAAGYSQDTRFTDHDMPVVGVTWSDAQTYCQWAGAQLPTEAQWEKAVRGPLPSPAPGEGQGVRVYPWGNQPASCKYAVMNEGNGDGCGLGYFPARVGSKPLGASPYSALDMAGNLAEWVSDWYAASYYAASPARNPPGPATGTHRVTRGGSMVDVARGVRATARNFDLPGSWGRDVGFRCGLVTWR
jgi:formylglycine-generating enzyme required for sulfatase activity